MAFGGKAKNPRLPPWALKMLYCEAFGIDPATYQPTARQWVTWSTRWLFLFNQREIAKKEAIQSWQSGSR